MRTITLIITGGLAALALAACGAEGQASGSEDREAKAREALLNFARCMRENGVDMPDPQVNEDGGVVLGARRAGGPGRRGSDATFERAEEECRKHMADLEPPKLSEEQQREMREAALAHARCMRGNGVPNFPDPTFGEDGGARIRLGGRGGLDPRSPAFQRAQEKCEDKLPFRRGGGGPSLESRP